MQQPDEQQSADIEILQKKETLYLNRILTIKLIINNIRWWNQPRNQKRIIL